MNQNEKVRITTAISDHCGQNGQGHPGKCLKITQEIFPNIPWQFVGLEEDRCVFEAYVEPSIAEAYEQETRGL
jgi:hypothetical protein